MIVMPSAWWNLIDDERDELDEFMKQPWSETVEVGCKVRFFFGGVLFFFFVFLSLWPFSISNEYTGSPSVSCP